MAEGVELRMEGGSLEEVVDDGFCGFGGGHGGGWD